ncbi:MAG: RecQ family ATP-dependent DNA helicase [Akkermansiaceae bacterium]|nr:RecQ family ATP-dependent DNA helicase [Armatimonadota bacterium]
MTPDPLQAEFTRLFGHADFRPGQREIVEGVLDGRDTLAILPTGGGKSVTYQFPAMLTEGATLILSPLIALMKDQAENLPPPVAERTTLINSSLDPGEVGRRLSMVKAGRLKLVYAAPERLRQPTFLHALRRANIAMVVIDEAHCISQWGHDFRPDYRAVGKAIAALNPRIVLAVTATATPEVAHDIEKEVGRPLHRILRPTFRDNLRLTCRKVANEDEKLQATLEYCRDTPGAGLVYATSREKCEQLARMLKRYGVEAGFYHAGLPSEERAAAQDRFMRGDVRVMAATVAFGMGVDKSDIRFLVHYNPSRTLENYYQEAGRAGRDGEPSECILLHSAPDATNALRRMREDTLELPDLQGVYNALKMSVGKARIGTVTWDGLFQSMNGDAGRVRSTLPVLEEVGLIARHTDIPRRFALYPEYNQQFEEAEPVAEWGDCFAGVIGGGGEWDAFELAEATGIPLRDLEETILRCQDAGHLTYRALGGREPLFEILPTPPDVKARMEAMLRERVEGATEKAKAMVAYAKEHKCRHGQIARYFGDRWANVPCGKCDVCAPKKGTGVRTSDTATESSPVSTVAPPLAALTLVHDLASGRSPFAVGKSGLVRALRGTPDAPIRPERTGMFGALATFKKAELERLADALVEQNYLSRDDNDEYRRLYLTTPGRDAVRDEHCDMEWRTASTPKQKIPIARSDAVAGTKEDADEDPVLFETLRAWRREQAEAENVPPFVVFADKVLHAIAATKPTNEFDLLDVPGIGPSKAAKFGEAVLDIVRKHNRDN